MSTKATCSIDGCEKPHHSRGWCGMHCERWRAHGDPLWLPPTPADRFWSHVDQYGPDGFHSQTGANLGPCWLWTASLDGGGYGQMRVAGRSVLAHRFAYELLVGLIPPRLQLNHLCRVRHCVNPGHLEPVTQAENHRRGFWAAKTACPQGHDYSPENTYVHQGQRHCRACRRAHQAAYYARKSAG